MINYYSFFRISTKRKSIKKNISVDERIEEKETNDNDGKQGEENDEKKDEEKDEKKDEEKDEGKEEEEKRDREKDEDGRDSPDQVF